MPPTVLVLKLPNTWAMFRIMYLIMALMSLMSLISLMRGVQFAGCPSTSSSPELRRGTRTPRGGELSSLGDSKQRDLISMSRK
jgi:hypothetical protein